MKASRALLFLGVFLVLAVTLLGLQACGGGGGGDGRADGSKFGEMVWGTGRWQAAP